MTSFYERIELEQMGFKSLGSELLISRNARFYMPDTISLGSNVRIDDFCVLSGEIEIGSYIHVGAYTAIYGKLGFKMEDYTGISPRCIIFTAMDDFSGDYLISPMQPVEFTNVTGGKVVLKKFSQIGAGCVVFPNLTVEEGVVVGAMSLVKESLSEWMIYAGIPAKYKKLRKQNIKFIV
ncbi:MAG: acyltransferase [Bacteroidota bacterium]